MQLISTFSFLEILAFFFSNRNVYYNVRNLKFLAFHINFTSGSISNVHTCVKVYTSCQFGAFFTKCTMLLHIRSTNHLIYWFAVKNYAKRSFSRLKMLVIHVWYMIFKYHA